MCHIKQFASCTEGGSYTNNELSWGYFNHKSVKDSHSIQYEKKKGHKTNHSGLNG